MRVITVSEAGTALDRKEWLDELQQAEPGGVDAAFDAFGVASFRQSWRALSRTGTLVCYGLAPSTQSGTGDFVQGLGYLAGKWLLGGSRRVRICSVPWLVRTDGGREREVPPRVCLMGALLLRIVERKAAFRALVAVSLGMFVLVQLLFRTQLEPGRPALPDERLFYSAQQLVGLLDGLGPAGRAVYGRLHLVDMAFPLVYGLFLAVLVVRFWSGRGGRTVAILASFPFVATLADLAENVCIRIVSAQVAAGRAATEIVALAPWAASLAGFATATKWTAAALSLLIILAGATQRVWIRHSHR